MRETFVPTTTLPPGIEFEQHFSVQRVAKMWSLGVDKVRELFGDEPDVLKIGHEESRYKRGSDSASSPGPWPWGSQRYAGRIPQLWEQQEISC